MINFERPLVGLALKTGTQLMVIAWNGNDSLLVIDNFGKFRRVHFNELTLNQPSMEYLANLITTPRRD